MAGTYEITLYADGIDIFGYACMRTRAEAESKLDKVREHAARFGGSGQYEEIAIIRHSKHCFGCPDTFGLGEECEQVATYSVTAD